MNRLTTEARAKILGCLVEGNSIRATCRMTGADKKTVLRLLASVGAACAAFHDKNVRNVPSRRVQCDEIWSFCYAKQKNVPKLMVSYLVASREIEDAMRFMDDLQKRLANRVQLTSDGLKVYAIAVRERMLTSPCSTSCTAIQKAWQ